MKPKYPKILSWQARKADIPNDIAKALWIEALRDATHDCAVIESPEYWKSTVDHLLQRLAAEARARHAVPFGWGSLVRLPARQWLHGLTTVEAMFSIGLRIARELQRRPGLHAPQSHGRQGPEIPGVMSWPTAKE